jgi:hypothetical protein
LFYEKRLNSPAQLLKELQTLDLDAGIRVIGRHQGRQCFAFVTRSVKGHTVMVYGMKREGKESIPEKRLLTKDFADASEAAEFLSHLASKPFQAFVY